MRFIVQQVLLEQVREQTSREAARVVDDVDFERSEVFVDERRQVLQLRLSVVQPQRLRQELARLLQVARFDQRKRVRLGTPQVQVLEALEARCALAQDGFH